MALLDSILGGLLGGGSSPLGSILGGLLGGGGGAGAGGLGGLGGLLQRMQQAGLGQVAQSWVGNGENQPIAPGDLEKVFRPGELDHAAQQSGMGKGDILSQLSQMLPHAVDKATPGGQMPEGEADPFSTEATGNPRL